MNIRALIAGLNPYANCKPLKKYDACFNSLGVFELPDGVVKKVYDPNDKIQWGRFEHEHMILEYLTRSECDFVPRLLYADEKNATLYMTNCGTCPTVRTPELDQEIDRLMHLLEEKYGLVRSENIGRKRYRYSGSLNNSGRNNVTQRDGKTYIIDFGSKRWKIVTRHFIQSPRGPIKNNNPIVPKTLQMVSKT